ncbi:MAG: protein translocase subunit SecDF [Imperialibacter sp.]|uniref:protein translocase subunit SecDF n=1 Tax=Imperialibacter sp. TaxID=2038411 RepID=UPI0032EABD6B
MKNRFLISTLIAVISFICFYFLSFTWLAYRFETKASMMSLNADGTINPAKKVAVTDSLMVNPVITILGFDYTLSDIKQRELHLGLDLQGGVNMVLEVSQQELLLGLSEHSNDGQFRKALQNAQVVYQQEKVSFVNAFASNFAALGPERKLSEIFANANNREKITFESSDSEVIAYLNDEVENAIGRTFNILRTRIDKFGVTSPNIQRQPGSNRIQVELPGVDNPDRVRKLLQGVAKLEFHEVMDKESLYNTLGAMNRAWVNKMTAMDTTRQVTSVTPVESTSSDLAALLATNEAELPASQSDSFPLLSLLVPSYELAYAIRDTARINQVLSTPSILEVVPMGVTFKWGMGDENEETGEKVAFLYAIKENRGGRAGVDGSYIMDARQEFEQGKPMVSMQMNQSGAQKWKTMTARNLGQQVAIVLDDQVYSAPVVQSEIPNGNSSITGNFSMEEAKDLANVLKTGKLPASTKIVEEAVIGPSLGQDSISQGLVSMFAGLGMVILFMVAYYHKGGLIANLALFANVFFILGILAQFSAALTLPGMAGIVLTIGMSVDANVLIFERIKEEMANGNNLQNSIKMGYERAFSSIIDSNATTFLVGLILYWFGMGVIKGFALVLMIGIACSLLTAVFLTRWSIEWLARRNASLSFETPLARLFFKKPSFNFIGNRKFAYWFSGIILVAGLASAVMQKGYIMGVDFKGGRSYVIRFGHPIEGVTVRDAAKSTMGGAGLEVKSFGPEGQFKITTGLLAGDDSQLADQSVAAALNQALSQLDKYQPEIMSSSKIGPTIADDIKDSAKTSFLLCIGGIFLYILIRFRKWQYSAGAVLALIHDALMIFAWFSLIRWAGVEFEIDQVFVAALLTVIGYSINDTVVVFDRIREFASQKTGVSLESQMNESLNKTLSRTVITSLTVFIVVAILLTFGGAVLRGFSFALLIGVVFGTYSSLFIASPILIDFQAFAKKLTVSKSSFKKVAA